MPSLKPLAFAEPGSKTDIKSLRKTLQEVDERILASLLITFYLSSTLRLLILMKTKKGWVGRECRAEFKSPGTINCGANSLSPVRSQQMNGGIKC